MAFAISFKNAFYVYLTSATHELTTAGGAGCDQADSDGGSAGIAG